ncbi:putative leucine-rich repeat-containing protein DDB_G0290503 isoform X2 [Periplaneta americana]|uniref:putative leucine-rich repeat-containing protein DDB_G0290503 isoform X2 n=1 Tax=Periplaneta americana TaxID=6978 RepID=UPI0037E7841D
MEQEQLHLETQHSQNFHGVENSLQERGDAGLQLRDCNENSVISSRSEMNHDWMSERVLSEVTTETNKLMKWSSEMKVKIIENDHQIQALNNQHNMGITKTLSLQMRNEQLSQEMGTVQQSVIQQAKKINQVLELCEGVCNYGEELRLEFEHIAKAKIDLCIQNATFSKDLKACYEDLTKLILDYGNVRNLKETVEQEHRVLTEEIDASNITCKKLSQEIDEMTLTLNLEEDKCSSLHIQEKETNNSLKIEETHLKEELQKATERLTSIGSKEDIEKDIHTSNCKIIKLEELLQTLSSERDCLKSQAINEKEFIERVSNEEKVLREKLISESEIVDHINTENTSKRIKQEESIRENDYLLQQICDFEEQHKDIDAKLEDCKTKEKCLDEDLLNIHSNIEEIKAKHIIICNEYKSELCGLQDAYEVIKTGIDSKYNKLQEQKIEMSSLQHSVEETNLKISSLNSEIHSVKASTTDELQKIETLTSLVEEEREKIGDLYKSRKLNENQMNKLKVENEEKLKFHCEFKKEMLASIKKLKDDASTVKKQRDAIDANCKKNRQDLMKYLDECRYESLKKTNDMEKELTQQKKENNNLREKINNTNIEKESVEKNFLETIKVLENKIKQLKTDLENETIQSEIWKKSKETQLISSVSCPPSKEDHLKTEESSESSTSIISSRIPERKKFEYDERSDSEHSSIDFHDIVDQRKRARTVFSEAVFNITPRTRKGTAGSREFNDNVQDEPLDLLSTI